MNILVVAPWVPWPPSSGAHLRLANMLEALSEVGELDVFLVPSAPPRDSKPPKGLRLRRHVTFVSPPAGRVRRIFRAGRWLIGSRLPYEVHEHPRRWLRRAFAQWVEARYDLVWFTRLHMYALFDDLVAGPTIVDVDDVEDRKARGRLAVLRRTRAGSLDPRWPLLAVHAAVNAQRWRRFQQRTIGGVDAALVCSEDDRRRLGGTNVIVVPNGYAAPARPAGRITVSDPPTVLLQGLLSYTPNTYGALWFAKAVLPRLGQAVPGVRLRLVGTVNRQVEALGALPGVTVTGWVPDMAAELARADLAVAPILYGGGTRIKILEAFAHRLPVVSTTVGVEGLDAVAGRHLLVADDPRAFADACARALLDEPLRKGLVDEAERLFLERYQWASIRADAAELARAVARR